MHATEKKFNNKLGFMQHVLVFSDCDHSVTCCSVLLLCTGANNTSMHTIDSIECDGHLHIRLKHSTAVKDNYRNLLFLRLVNFRQINIFA